MRLLARLRSRLRFSRRVRSSKPVDEPRPLPGEPDVFECKSCGKVFESQRRSPCPECDSADLTLLTD